VTGPYLEEKGFSTTAYFYNPNIHPYREWKHRLDTLKEWSASAGTPLIADESYPLEQNVRMLVSAPSRCSACLRDRLDRAAAVAGELGLDAFTSTLMLSPYTDHEILRRAGEEASGRSGIEFIYRDIRSEYPRSVAVSRSLGLYRQPYCGCVFSERDRFEK
jgi:predicted adenine nucleotide alpha hydrolase (AANH) superfamily ATPase